MRGGSPRQQKPRYGACGGAFSAVCPYICPATNYPRAYTCSTSMHTHIHRANAFLVGQAQYRDVYRHCPRIYSVNVDLTSQKAQKLTPQCHVLQLASSTEIFWTTKATIRRGILGHSTKIREERVELNDGKDKRKYPTLFVFCYLPKNAIAWNEYLTQEMYAIDIYISTPYVSNPNPNVS